MNILETTAQGIGRIVGGYKQGIDSVFSTSGSRPSVNDGSAFLDPIFWGQALLGSREPRTKKEFVAAFKSWVYICVKLNGQSVASIPLRLYVAKKSTTQKLLTSTKTVSKERRKYLYSKANLASFLTKAVEVEEITEHPFLDLMKNVNSWNNQFDFLELTVMFLDLTGECYWWLPSISIGGESIPQQVWVIPSQYMNPILGKNLTDPIESYQYKSGNVEAVIPADQIIEIVYPSPHHTFTGFGCVEGVSTAVYIRSQMDAFEVALFENKGRPGGIFIPKSNISKQDRERLEQQLKDKFSGARKAGKYMITPKDLEYVRDVMTQEEMSYIDGRRLNREEITAAFNVPMAFFDVKAIESNVKIGKQLYAENGILPRTRRIEQKINEQLMPRYDKNIFVAFDNPVPQDKAFNLKESTELVKAGIKTIDEDRADRGMEPIEGGDVAYIDGRLVPLGTVPESQVEEVVQLARAKIRRLVG